MPLQLHPSAAVRLCNAQVPGKLHKQAKDTGKIVTTGISLASLGPQPITGPVTTSANLQSWSLSDEEDDMLNPDPWAGNLALGDLVTYMAVAQLGN